MGFRIKMQIVRENTEYESYRITLPRALVLAHNLRDKDFELKIEKDKIILIPRNKA